MKNYNLALWQVEEKLLGIDHSMVGSLMAHKWNFPVVLVDAIRYHHAPSLARSKQQLGAIINVANALSKDERALTNDPNGNIIHPEAMQILNIDDAQVTRMKEMLLRNRSLNSAARG